MSRITLYAMTGLLAVLATAAVASAEYDEGKPECPPDRMCTMSYGDEPEYSDANDTSPECEECMEPVDAPAERGDGDGDSSDDCFEDDAGNLVCYRSVEGNATDEPCTSEACAYGDKCETLEDGTVLCQSHAGCDAPTSSMDHPSEAGGNDCPSLGGPVDDDVGSPEPGPTTEAAGSSTKDAPAGALVGALAALGVAAAVLAARRR